MIEKTPFCSRLFYFEKKNATVAVTRPTRFLQKKKKKKRGSKGKLLSLPPPPLFFHAGPIPPYPLVAVGK